LDEAAPTISGGGQGRVSWVLRNNSNANACERSMDEPAGTLFFGHRSNWAAWVQERPSPTIVTTRRAKDGLIAGRQLPEGESNAVGGHGWNGDSTSSKGGDAVRITVLEAAVLQSFRPGYPWQGAKTKQFEQVGNAVPPLLAEHVLAMATGIRRQEAAA
jgi:DNA (cytosine-5)-methyltransferase 1